MGERQEAGQPATGIGEMQTCVGASMVQFPQQQQEKGSNSTTIAEEPQLKCFGALRVNNHQWVTGAVTSRATSSQLPAAEGEIGNSSRHSDSRHQPARSSSAAAAAEAQEVGGQEGVNGATWAFFCLGQLSLALPPRGSSSSMAAALAGKATTPVSVLSLGQQCKVRCQGLSLRLDVADDDVDAAGHPTTASAPPPAAGRQTRLPPRGADKEEKSSFSSSSAADHGGDVQQPPPPSLWDIPQTAARSAAAVVGRVSSIVSSVGGVASTSSPKRFASDMLDASRRISMQAAKITLAASRLVSAPVRWGLGSGSPGGDGK
mmetsp:Transcript_61251/g.145810  ORF Transcript_61251/g.145810 Transcript_61251/m.145810 type:complete len:318 (-) Transcript_61251:322-1275(-)